MAQARKYSKILTAVWQSRKFRSLGNDDMARLLYLYFHTCGHSTRIGCFHMPIGYICADLGWTKKASREALARLLQTKLIKYNEAQETVWLADFIKHDKPTNKTHADAYAKLAFSLPDIPEKAYVINDLIEQDQQPKNFDLRAEAERLKGALAEPLLSLTEGSVRASEYPEPFAALSQAPNLEKKPERKSSSPNPTPQARDDDEAPPDSGLPTDFDQDDPQALVGEILPTGQLLHGAQRLTPAQQIVKAFAQVRENLWGRETFPAAGQDLVAQQFVNAKTTLPVERVVEVACMAIQETAQRHHANNPLDAITSLRFFAGPVTKAIAAAERAEQGLDIPDEVRANVQANGSGKRPYGEQENVSDDQLAQIVRVKKQGYFG